jgi:ADP-heptose:LPS heptosyltransferase
MHVTDTAALIATLDIVVTVDSFVAHLAGALGKPACILLKHDADWRWMQGERTAWYPRAKLMRQRKDGDWDGPLAEV